MMENFNNIKVWECMRIKEAFLLKFHESLAENYFITGKRGEPKRIRLPEELNRVGEII